MIISNFVKRDLKLLHTHGANFYFKGGYLYIKREDGYFLKIYINPTEKRQLVTLLGGYNIPTLFDQIKEACPEPAEGESEQ